MSTDYLKIAGGTVYDPANGVDGEVRDIWIAGGKVVEPPGDPDDPPSRVIDASGLVVMPGGVDMHCHIVGSKVNTARMMCPELGREAARLPDPAAPRRHDGDRADHVPHRLQVRRPRLHDGLRRGDRPARRAARA